MSGVAALDFWIDLASPYAYLSAMRIASLVQPANISVRWRPVVLGAIFREQGWDSSPFNIYPAKGRHMWRDVERRATGFGVPVQRPSGFPRNSLLAHRVMLVGLRQGWGERFAVAVFTAEFRDGLDISRAEILAICVATAGGDPDAALASAAGDDIKEELKAETAQATGAGVFGAPTFVVGNELFWGDDRLEDALLWARSEHPLQVRPRP